MQHFISHSTKSFIEFFEPIAYWMDLNENVIIFSLSLSSIQSTDTMYPINKASIKQQLAYAVLFAQPENKILFYLILILVFLFQGQNIAKMSEYGTKRTVIYITIYIHLSIFPHIYVDVFFSFICSLTHTHTHKHFINTHYVRLSSMRNANVNMCSMYSGGWYRKIQ